MCIFSIRKEYLLHRRYPKYGSPSQTQSQKFVPIQDRTNLYLDTAQSWQQDAPFPAASVSNNGGRNVKEQGRNRPLFAHFYPTETRAEKGTIAHSQLLP